MIGEQGIIHRISSKGCGLLVPHTKLVFWDPEIHIASLESEVPFVLIREDEVVIVIEFPYRANLDNFLTKMAALQ